MELGARLLDEGYDLEILEMHHRDKVDAPSGTALQLGETAARALAGAGFTLVLAGRPVPATCLDLSAGGARVRIAEALVEGQQVILRMAGLPDLPGWMLESGEEASLRFDWAAEDAPAGLLERLRTLAAA